MKRKGCLEVGVESLGSGINSRGDMSNEAQRGHKEGAELWFHRVSKGRTFISWRVEDRQFTD